MSVEISSLIPVKGSDAFQIPLVLSDSSTRPPEQLSPHPGFGRVLDLCVDADAIDAGLDGGDLAGDRARMGVSCGRTSSNGVVRYAVVLASGGEPLFSEDELLRAVQVVMSERDRARREAQRRPTPDMFFPMPPSSMPAGAPCPSRGLRNIEGWAVEKSSTRADLDGDGRLDRFIAYSIGKPDDLDDEGPHLRVELASGSIIDREADEWDWGSKVLGASDLNDDGQAEIWLEVGGNTAHNVGLVMFAGCLPREVYPEHSFGFLYWASGQSSAGVTVGVECTDLDGDGTREIVETEQQEAVPDYQPAPLDEGWSYVAYRLDVVRAREIKRDDGTDLDDRPRTLKWSSGLNCDGITY